MRYRIERIGIHVLAFFVARCQVMGLYPFVVPFFMAAYRQEESSLGLFVMLIGGMLSRLSLLPTIKYGLVLLLLLIMMKRRSQKALFLGSAEAALSSGVILWCLSMPFEYIVTRDVIRLLYCFLDGVIAICSMIVFEQGFVALRVGTGRRFATNERFVGVFAFMILFLFGCPVIEKPIHILFLLSAYLLLYHTYRYESGVGIATGSVAGLVLSFQTGEIAWLVVMIVLAGLILILKELGKIGVMLGFLAGYLLLGFAYETSLLSKPLLISAIICIFAFWFTPKSFLKRSKCRKEDKTAYSQDLLLQEITRERVNDFGQAFLNMEKMLTLHEDEVDYSLPNGLSNMYLSGDGISLLNAVESQNGRMMEMRRNFVHQLGRIGESIIAFPKELSQNGIKSERFENQIAEELARDFIVVTKAVLTVDKDERVEAYVSCVSERDTVITGRMIAGSVSRILSNKMVCVKRQDEPVGRKECAYTFVEEGKYMLTTGIVRMNRQGENQCGDNYSVIKVDSTKAALMLSDGMGTGECASVKSEQVVELLEELLESGFRRELAIWLLNSFISFLSDGTYSSTLDLTMVDLYDGTTDFIKLGASTTFIKRKDRVECIRSTSLPVGLLEQVEFDTCARRLYHGDIIVMMSDGVMEGVIFENKETYLADLIASIDTNNVQLMAERIMKDICRMHEDGLRDDSTVLVAGLWER